MISLRLCFQVYEETYSELLIQVLNGVNTLHGTVSQRLGPRLRDMTELISGLRAQPLPLL